MDGNFHFNMKPKRTDPDDIPLTGGGGYFVNDADFKEYSKTVDSAKKEVTLTAVSDFGEAHKHCSRRHATNSQPWARGSTRVRSLGFSVSPVAT